MFVKTYIRDNLAVIIMSDNVNWVQFNRGTEICSVRLRPDKAGAILVGSCDLIRYWNVSNLEMLVPDFKSS